LGAHTLAHTKKGDEKQTRIGSLRASVHVVVARARGGAESCRQTAT
jgi:hypothetical protein